MARVQQHGNIIDLIGVISSFFFFVGFYLMEFFVPF